MTPKEKKELSDEEKEYKSMRKQIQEKLIKFATRIPVFMYLTDYRERSLKDVITQLEPGLFKKVTGLDVKDFELLVSLNVFNGSLMNDAIYKFKRYEDSSLSYTGIDKHEGEDIGGWDTVIKRKEYDRLFFNQQNTMEAPEPVEDDVPENPFAFVASVSDEDEEEVEAPAPKKPEPRKVTPIASYQSAFSTPLDMVAEDKAPYEEKTNAVKPGIYYSPYSTRPSNAPVKGTEKPKVDTSGVGKGSKLMHKKFGEGTVVEIKKGMMTIQFDQGEKKFQFPLAIEMGFFTIL